MRDDVVALFVDPLSVYPKLVREWYDEARDARTYTGALPVVAHPPCGPWGRLRHLSRNDDPELAVIAVTQVRRWGGVLEHPRFSLLIDTCRLPRPGELPDEFGGWTLEVSQCDFGHPARKMTWLYFVGVPRSAIVLPPRREPTHWISGRRTRSAIRNHTPVPPGMKICSPRQRRRTPIGFARWLLDLAALAKPCCELAGLIPGRRCPVHAPLQRSIGGAR